MGHYAKKSWKRQPSKGCKQRLSTEEQIERTQQGRMKRKAKREAKQKGLA